jgi:hypothetical protein
MFERDDLFIPDLSQVRGVKVERVTYLKRGGWEVYVYFDDTSMGVEFETEEEAREAFAELIAAVKSAQEEN